MNNPLDNARRFYENLNERERKLVALLGVIAGVIVVFLPLYLLTSAISSIEDTNREIDSVLHDISRARPRLQAREARREAAQQRYDQKAPPLGSFIEAKAREEGLTVREVNDQPEKVVDDFTRRHTRVTLPGVSLKPVIKMMANIENSPYPVAIERIRVEHFSAGDRYNVQLGVIAYDKRKEGSGADEDSTRDRQAGAGPPSP